MSELFPPELYPCMEVGMTFFEVFQKNHYEPASRGKYGQTDHNEKYPLKDRKE